MTIDSTALIQTYAKFPIEIKRGKGSFVWDSNDKKYLDFYGGHAVCLLGHSPDSVVKAITKQCEELMFYSNIFDLKPSAELATQLSKTLLPAKYQIYFSNSGSEANETALKIARKLTGKNNIISFKNAFHGRGAYALSVTGIDSYHQFSPDFDDFTSFATLGDMDSVRNLADENTAAIICEPIQSIGGIKMAEKEFYQELAKFSQENNIVLIFDEIQTGLGRTGTFWFAEQLGIAPDIITSAKGIASGLPLSVVLVDEKIAKTIKVGEHATTFGGGPVVCAAGKATLDIILAEGFLSELQKNADYLRTELEKNFEVFGAGFLLGIKTDKIGKDLVKKCLENNLIIGTSMEPNIIRIMPPINISREEIDQFLEIFTKQVKS
jgi:acetylornithine/succinyldiaminopimelate/putrescine aminotransferase